MVSVEFALLLLAFQGAAPSNYEEIVVTGERVKRSLKETDSSVEVFDPRRLELEPGAHRLDDLFEATPNVLLGNPGQGPTIRGQDTTGPLIDLAAFLGGTRPRMTLNIDGRAASYNEFILGSAPLWDVEQVEIFRSPQSTVEGRNSIAGATYVRTRSPGFEWEAAARVLAGGLRARQVSAMVGGPLGETVAFRIAADGRRSRPWSLIGDNMRGADPDHDDYGLVRGKLLATLSVLPGARLELGVQHLRSRAPQAVTTRLPFEERRDRTAAYGVFVNRITSATLRGEVPLTAELTGRTIASAAWSTFRRFAPPGRGEALNRVTDHSLESRFEWRRGERLRASGGFHYLATKLGQDIDLTAIVGTGAFDDRQSALGLFGEAEAALTRRLTAVAGLRYQRDTQRRQGAIVGALTLPVDYDRSFHFWLPKVALRWDLTDDVRVGASVQRASNPGGASLNFVTGEPELLEAETLWSTELFARARLLNGRLSVSANLFRNAHRSAQRAIGRVFVGPGSTLTWFELYNLDRARSEGLEASVDWRVTRALTLRGGLGLLRARILDAGDAAAFQGKSFARAPSRSATAAIEWRPIEQVILSGRLRHPSGYFSDDLNSEVRRVKAGTEADVRGALALGRFTLSAFARNVTDAFAVTYYFSPISAVPNRPREIGLSLERRF